jgi:hypothetical protein
MARRWEPARQPLFGGSAGRLATCQAANHGSIARHARTVPVPACVGDDQKVAKKVSMPAKVGTPAWSQDPVGLPERQPSRS